MNPNDCARLVNLLVSTWPSGVKGHVWTDTLGALDYDPARSAYVSLRDSEERPPSVARYLAAYRAERALDDTHDAAYCELCGGDGWATSPPERAHNPRTCRPTPDRPCMCTAVEPCRCSAGQANRDVHRRIIEANERTRK